MKSLRKRLWPWNGHSSTHSNLQSPLNGQDTAGAPGADLFPLVHHYNVQASASRSWSPLGIPEEGKHSVQLQELGGIRVDRDIQVSQPENAYHRI